MTPGPDMVGFKFSGQPPGFELDREELHPSIDPAADGAELENADRRQGEISETKAVRLK